MRKPRSKLNSFPRVTQLSIRARTWPHAGKLPLVADKLPQISRLSLCPNAYGPRVPTYGPRVWIIPPGAEHMIGVQLHRCPSRLTCSFSRRLPSSWKIRTWQSVYMWLGSRRPPQAPLIRSRRRGLHSPSFGETCKCWLGSSPLSRRWWPGNMCRPYMTGSQHHRPPQMASKTMIKQG